MAQTDGYIGESGDDSWKYSNVGGAQGTITSPDTTGISIRTSNGSQPGTAVNGEGATSEGPALDFATTAGLLSQVSETTSTRPNILWAGVNPMSLQEALIVWNTNIVLLNKNKVKVNGAVTEVLATVGRLMIVRLEDPVAIDGSESANITLNSGAVGFYSPGDTAPAEAEGEGEEEEESCSTDLGELTKSEGGSQVYQTVFSTMCNPSAQCGEFTGNTSQFVVNNGMEFEVKCTHTFSYVELTNKCGEQAAVWQVSMELYGGTLPGEVFPLDQLATIDTGSVGSTNFADGWPATLKENVACATDGCPDATVYIYGRFGPPVEETGTWNGAEPGYEGQAVRWDCDEVNADIIDSYVPEDIIKPIQRTLPVGFYEDWFLKTTDITIPSTIITTTLTLPTDIITGVIEYVSAVTTDSVILPVGEGALVSSIATGSADIITNIPVSSGTFLSGTGATGVIGAQTGSIVVATNVSTTALTVVSDVISPSGTFATEQANVAYVDAANPYDAAAAVDIFTQIDTGSLTYIGEPVTGIAGFSSELVPVFGLPLLVEISNPTTNLVSALDGPEASLVDSVLGNVQVVPTAIGTAEVVIPTGEGAVVTAIGTDTIVAVNSFATDLITYLTSTPGSAISDYATSALTAASSTGEDVISYVQAAVSQITVVTASIDYAATPELDQAILATGIQDGQLLAGPIQTASITGISGTPGTLPLATYLTAAGPVTVVTAYSTDAIVYCQGGAVVTATVMVNPLTTVLNGQAAAMVTSVTTDTPQEVLVSPTAIDVASTVISIVTAIATDSQNVVASLNTVNSPVSTAAIPLLTAVSADIPSFTPLPLGAANQLIIDDIVTSAVDVPTSVGTSDLGTLGLTLATSLETDSLTLLTSIVLTNVTRIPITEIGEIQTQAISNWVEDRFENMVYDITTASHATTSLDVLTGATSTQFAQLVTDINEVAVNFSPAITAVNEQVYNPVVANAVDTAALDIVTDLATQSITGELITFINGAPSTSALDYVSDLQTVAAGTTQVVIVSDLEIGTTSLVVDIATATATATFNSGEIVLQAIVEGAEGDVTVISSTDQSNCDVQHKILMHDGAISATTIVTSSDGGCCSEGTCELGSSVLQQESDCTGFMLLRAHYVDSHSAPTRDKCPCYDCEPEDADDPDNNRYEPPPTGGSPEPCTIRVRRLNRRWCSGRNLGGAEESP